MRKTEAAVAILVLAASGGARAQVVSPAEIRDVQMRELQEKHLPELKAAALAISGHSFPYRLYFSRTLDLNEEQQQRSDQRSVRFDKFRNRTVVEITANYYAAYSAELMKPEDRAKRTLDDVIVPMMRIIVPRLIGEEKVEGFAFEISHHVRKKVLGVSTENPENVAYVLPRASVARFLTADDASQLQAALLKGSLFVDRVPLDGWGADDSELATAKDQAKPAPLNSKPPAGGWSPALPPLPGGIEKAGALQSSAPPARLAPTPRDTSPEALAKLQAAYQDALNRLTRDLGPEAHFVAYAPPNFIAFHNGVYLQLAITTTLAKAGGSRYELAALAFDEHVARLIRGVLAALPAQTEFDGIDFSASVRVAGAADSGGEAVEFIFPADALACYRDYDCTGQKLIDSGFVLINGERVALDLQRAESVPAAQK